MDIHVYTVAAAVAVIAGVGAALILRKKPSAIWSPPRELEPSHPYYEATCRAQIDIARLTREEKLDLIMGIGWQGGPAIGNVAPIASIGFRGLNLQDSPMGVSIANDVTAFPSGLNVASTFDKILMEQYGAAMGKEFRELGFSIQLGPAMNLMRAPAAGRNWEGPGGDPYLASVSASRIVRGIQSNGVIATAKHFIGNEQELFRTTSSSNIDKRTFMEVYFAPFEACVREGVGAIMGSYNKINQKHACSSPIVNELLKSDLDFRGIFMTDWYANYDYMVSDLIMPGFWRVPVLPKWYNWTGFFASWPLIGQFFPRSPWHIPEARLNDMATRILATYYKFGQDKPDFPSMKFNCFKEQRKTGSECSGRAYKFNEQSTAIARKVAAASVVVVKNERNVLPLSKEKKPKIAIIGEDARGPKCLNEFPMRQGNDGTLAQGWGSGTANFPLLVSPFEGIRDLAIGCEVVSSFDNDDLKTAARVAADADIAIVCANADSGELILALMNIVEGNWGDRNDLKLWHGGDALIEAVAAVNKNTVVVLHTVGPVDMPWFNHPNIAAVVFAGLPGQESGNSLADVLFGDTNPSGRLPYTIFKSRSEYAADVLYWSLSWTPQINYSEGLFIDYRHADQHSITPVVPFGHGLSYTTFSYENLHVSEVYRCDNKQPSHVVRAVVTVTNTGMRGGHEVLQLYVTFPLAAEEPPKLLKGFEKIWLEAGETAEVEFLLDAQLDLRVWGIDADKWKHIDGIYRFMVGASSRDLRVFVDKSLNFPEESQS
ncbi:hypothetical protein HDU84_001298 [Entophlyctis sp. JEL0112]|nr:hypothetical protein HDU84_001298 [Entophlyctis sp. JEL0112]